MKNIFSLAMLSLISSSVFAMDINQMMMGHCQNVTVPLSRAGYYLKNTPSFHLGSIEFIAAQKKSNMLKLEGLDLQSGAIHHSLFERPNAVSSIERAADESVWMLSGFNLYQVTPDLGQMIDTVNIPSMDNSARTRGMGYDKINEQLIIAKSHEGILIFDLSTKVFVKTIPVTSFSPRPELSMVVDVAVDGPHAYILMTSLAEGGFNGVVTMNLSTGVVMSANEYDPRRAGVIDVVGRIYTADKKVVINNGGWIHVLDYEILVKNKMIRPKWLAIKKKVDGRDLYMTISGDFVFHDGKIKGCTSYPQTNPSTNQIEYVNDLVETVF